MLLLSADYCRHATDDVRRLFTDLCQAVPLRGIVDSGLVTSESSGSGAGWIDSYFVVEGERNKPSNACPP